jgi:putative sterol carrier protein
MSYTYGTKEWDEAFAALMQDLLDVESEPYIMGTPAWIATYETSIQNDADYKKLAQGWEGGVVIHISADPAVGLDDDMYLLLDLWHGDCRAVRLVPTEAGENGDFVLTATYDRWKQVMTKELDVVKGLMQGKIKLKGHLPTIVRYNKAAVRLVDLVADVNTIYLDEMDSEEIESFKPWIEFVRDEFALQ